MLPYLQEWTARGLPPHRITRHLLGLFAHQPAARAWRRLLSGQALTADTAADTLHKALLESACRGPGRPAGGGYLSPGNPIASSINMIGISSRIG